MVNKKVFRILLFVLLINFSHITHAADHFKFTSGNKQVSLLEVFVSQGCSSSPPAEKWINKFIDDPSLWVEVIPAVFHVDYWDYLGWKDPYARKEFSQRQRLYKLKENVKSVYTPGFVLNGKEWRGWFQKQPLPENDIKADPLNGTLYANRLDVFFDAKKEELALNVAILGFDLVTDIKRGENKGLKIKEQFVVLSHQEYFSNNNQWSVKIPTITTIDKRKFALSIWINKKGDQTPLQAAGTWLPNSI